MSSSTDSQPLASRETVEPPPPEDSRRASSPSAARFGRSQGENVSPLESWLSLATGSGLIWKVLRPRDGRNFNWTLPLAAAGGLLVYRGATRKCPVYRATGVDRSPRYSGPDALGIVTIRKSPAELYKFWRDLTNAPKFMSFVGRVEILDDERSRWFIDGPKGYSTEYVAEVVEDVADEGIRWRSVEGAPVDVRGSVRFTAAPGDRGTCVIASIVVGGANGGGIRGRLAKPFADYTIHNDLSRFKQLMETGEIATTEGQASGRKERPDLTDQPTHHNPPPPDVNREAVAPRY